MALDRWYVAYTGYVLADIAVELLNWLQGILSCERCDPLHEYLQQSSVECVFNAIDNFLNAGQIPSRACSCTIPAVISIPRSIPQAACRLLPEETHNWSFDIVNPTTSALQWVKNRLEERELEVKMRQAWVGYGKKPLPSSTFVAYAQFPGKRHLGGMLSDSKHLFGPCQDTAGHVSMLALKSHDSSPDKLRPPARWIEYLYRQPLPKSAISCPAYLSPAVGVMVLEPEFTDQDAQTVFAGLITCEVHLVPADSWEGATFSLPLGVRVDKPIEFHDIDGSTLLYLACRLIGNTNAVTKLLQMKGAGSTILQDVIANKAVGILEDMVLQNIELVFQSAMEQSTDWGLSELCCRLALWFEVWIHRPKGLGATYPEDRPLPMHKLLSDLYVLWSPGGRGRKLFAPNTEEGWEATAELTAIAVYFGSAVGAVVRSVFKRIEKRNEGMERRRRRINIAQEWLGNSLGFLTAPFKMNIPLKFDETKELAINRINRRASHENERELRNLRENLLRVSDCLSSIASTYSCEVDTHHLHQVFTHVYSCVVSSRPAIPSDIKEFFGSTPKMLQVSTLRQCQPKRYNAGCSRMLLEDLTSMKCHIYTNDELLQDPRFRSSSSTLTIDVDSTASSLLQWLLQEKIRGLRQQEMEQFSEPFDTSPRSISSTADWGPRVPSCEQLLGLAKEQPVPYQSSFPSLSVSSQSYPPPSASASPTFRKPSLSPSDSSLHVLTPRAALLPTQDGGEFGRLSGSSQVSVEFEAADRLEAYGERSPYRAHETGSAPREAFGVAGPSKPITAHCQLSERADVVTSHLPSSGESTRLSPSLESLEGCNAPERRGPPEAQLGRGTPGALAEQGVGESSISVSRFSNAGSAAQSVATSPMRSVRISIESAMSTEPEAPLEPWAPFDSVSRSSSLFELQEMRRPPCPTDSSEPVTTKESAYACDTPPMLDMSVAKGPETDRASKTVELCEPPSKNLDPQSQSGWACPQGVLPVVAPASSKPTVQAHETSVLCPVDDEEGSQKPEFASALCGSPQSMAMALEDDALCQCPVRARWWGSEGSIPEAASPVSGMSLSGARSSSSEEGIWNAGKELGARLNPKPNVKQHRHSCVATAEAELRPAVSQSSEKTSAAVANVRLPGSISKPTNQTPSSPKPRIVPSQSECLSSMDQRSRKRPSVPLESAARQLLPEPESIEQTELPSFLVLLTSVISALRSMDRLGRLTLTYIFWLVVIYGLPDLWITTGTFVNTAVRTILQRDTVPDYRPNTLGKVSTAFEVSSSKFVRAGNIVEIVNMPAPGWLQVRLGSTDDIGVSHPRKLRALLTAVCTSGHRLVSLGQLPKWDHGHRASKQRKGQSCTQSRGG